MPKYRIRYQSKSRPALRKSQVVRSTNSRKVINDTRRDITSLILRLGLPSDDITWDVSRLSGHLSDWEIISHNRDELTRHAAAPSS